MEIKAVNIPPQGVKITPPEGYEIDRENSTLDYIIFKKKSLAYDDIAEKLFKDKNTWNLSYDVSYICKDGYATPLNVTSKDQRKKILAINKLMNVARYLNGDWVPNFKDGEEPKWSIIMSGNLIDVFYEWLNNYGYVHFKTKELAQQAIEILGEDEIRLALQPL